jgi:hypothetical protein
MTINGLGFQVKYTHLAGGEEEQTRLQQEGKIRRVEQLRIAYYNHMDIPSHFGYSSFETLAEQRTMAGVIVITEQFRQVLAHPVLSQGMVGPAHEGRQDFTLDDLERLRNDRTIAKVYANGETDIFYATHPPSQALISREIPPDEG